jgi:hypothetical protein
MFRDRAAAPFNLRVSLNLAVLAIALIGTPIVAMSQAGCTEAARTSGRLKQGAPIEHRLNDHVISV